MNATPQELTPTTMEALREELERVRAQLAEYVGHEPTIREEMQHLSGENETLRKTAALLLVEYAEKNTVDLWDDDINSMTGRLDIEPSPDRHDSTRITYTRGANPPRKHKREPINHRVEAERHLSQAAHIKNDRQHHPIDPVASDFHLRMATVHATLARDEEQAGRTADLRDALTLLRRRETATREAVSVHIANGLASRETKRWKAALDLAKALDEADANLDEQIDRHLADDGWDPRSAWKTPASAVRADDPWAPAPDISADIPEPVRRVLAGHLAEMLLDRDNEALHQAARGITHELKREGADLTDAIKARITELTLGRDPSEPPF